MGIQVTVHLVVFAIRDSKLKILLTRPRDQSVRNRMAILGTRLRENESFEEAARRGLKAQTAADHLHLEQLYCSAEPKTNAGGRAFSVAYSALLPLDWAHVGESAVWHSVRDLPRLSPVQRRIVDLALKRLRKNFEHNTASLRLLGTKFTFPELQGIYETVLGRKLDKRNFRKKIESLGVLRPLAEWRRTGRKPARLYMAAAGTVKKPKPKPAAQRPDQTDARAQG